MEDQNVPENTPEQPPKKKLRDMLPEELKQYQRDAKRRSRERQRQEQPSEILMVDDYKLPEHQPQLLNRHSQKITQQIQSELSDKLSINDEWMIDMAASIVYAVEQKWPSQRVRFASGSTGIMVGGYFPDSAASLIAQYDRYSLSQSDSFTRLYQDFLKLSNKWTLT